MITKQTLQNWLAKDDLKSVLNGLYTLAKKYDNEQILGDVIIQSGRIQSLEDKRKAGTISLNDDHIESAKIRQALLCILNELPEDWSEMDVRTYRSITKTDLISNWKKLITIFIAGIALLIIIVKISGYNLEAILERKDKIEFPTEQIKKRTKVSTTGNKSPAIQTRDGDVNINYGENETKKDTILSAQKNQK